MRVASKITHSPVTPPFAHMTAGFQHVQGASPTGSCRVPANLDLPLHSQSGMERFVAVKVIGSSQGQTELYPGRLLSGQLDTLNHPPLRICDGEVV